MLDLPRIRALSFDCYGTLIDWQSGILRAVRPILARRGLNSTDADIITTFARAERHAERGPYTSYKDVLRKVMSELLSLLAPLPPSDSGPSSTSHIRHPTSDIDCLWLSIPHWPAFPDTPAALQHLHTRFKLAIFSNIDDDLFAATLPKLGITPDAVITAQQVRSYKPARPHFDELTRRLKLQPAQILHIAESRYHDIEPATVLGFPTVWVNRTGAAPSASGAESRAPEKRDRSDANQVVTTLAQLVDHLAQAP